MSAIFTQILNLSVSASFLILAVLILRLLLKNAPKGVRYILWAMVGLRLAIPFSFESRLSLIPNAQSFDASVETSTSYINHTAMPTQAQSQSLNLSEILPYIWICGVALMLLYMLLSLVRVRLMVRGRVLHKDNIYLCDNIDSPFVLGIVNPKIYLSSSMKKRDMKLVTLHEQTHIRHKDNIIKPLGFLLLSIYWFNPLCYIAYFLFIKDIELFCDESVTKALTKTARKKYSYALLDFSQKRLKASACPLAFAENDVKSRVKNILSYKKPALYVVVVSVMLCAVTMVLFMSSPVSAKIVQEYKLPKNLSQVVGEVEKLAPTEPPTEPPTEKPTEKKKETKKKTQESQQTNYSSSYDYSGDYSQDYAIDYVPLKIQPVYMDPMWEEQVTLNSYASSHSYENSGVQNAYDVTPYDGEIAWEPNDTDISNFN